MVLNEAEGGAAARLPAGGDGADPIELLSARDVRALLAGPPWRWLAGRATVLVSAPLLGAEARLRLQARLNFWRSICGCSAGGLAFLATLIWSAVRSARAGDWAFASIATALGLAILAALLAKLTAVAASRAAFAAEVLILWRRLDANERGERLA